MLDRPLTPAVGWWFCYDDFTNNQPMTYTITKEIKIQHDEYGFCFNFSTDEYGTVTVKDSAGPEIHISQDCIQSFIDVLEQFK